MKRIARQQLTKAKRLRNQADALFLRLPFNHPLDAGMHRITLAWLRIERLWEQQANCSQAR